MIESKLKLSLHTTQQLNPTTLSVSLNTDTQHNTTQPPPPSPSHSHSPFHSHIHMGPPPPPPNSLFNLLTVSLSLLTLTLLDPSIILVSYADSNNDTTETSPPPTPIAISQHSSSTFKPGVAIVVGVMTLVFSLTFLLLLYIKHCSGEGISAYSSRGVPLPSLAATRKNSGIDRSVVESLPIFRFGSLKGQKDGLDCAVCLNKFESAEVLRLLPKCKHAFHVECVDIWLDAHSTCPLCRNRVDPEDILLVMEDPKKSVSVSQRNEEECLDIEITESSKRRHSSVGEREWELRKKTASFRWSLDSSTSTSRKKNETLGIGIGIGCFVRPRKDGMLLLTQDTVEEERERDRISVELERERRLEHRIIVSPSPQMNGGVHRQHQRWSDVQPCDLLYLTSEMIISEVRRVNNRRQRRSSTIIDDRWNGRGIINSRSVSEITGLSRFPSRFPSSNNNNGTGGTEREEGLVSRWLAWISQSRSQPAVR